MKVDASCAWCSCTFLTERGAINRAKRVGLALYCGRVCSGLGRRKNKSVVQRKAEKRAYDVIYRNSRASELQVKKALYHQRTYDPKRAAKHRKKRMSYHIEYCRRPEQVTKKRAYDQQRRDAEYGSFAECARLLINLNTEILTRASREELAVIKGTACKAQQRRRSYGQSNRG